MRNTYPYFRDPRALEEIRKHKWIESQKLGEEVGFATAALDWIEKYGQEWKEIHAKEYKDNSVFIEQRKYRRFNLNQLVKLAKDNIAILAEGVNISFFGLMCRVDNFLPVGSAIKAYVPIEEVSGEKIICQGTIDRVIQSNSGKYELFLRFDNHSQRQVSSCSHFRR